MPTFKVKATKKDEDAELQIAGVTLKMSGTYKCVAVNPAGQAICAAQVTVTGRSRSAPPKKHNSRTAR